MPARHDPADAGLWAGHRLLSEGIRFQLHRAVNSAGGCSRRLLCRTTDPRIGSMGCCAAGFPSLLSAPAAVPVARPVLQIAPFVLTDYRADFSLTYLHTARLRL